MRIWSQDDQGGNLAVASRWRVRCPDSKTKFGSSPLGDLVKLREGRQHPAGAELRCLQVLSWAVGALVLPVQIKVFSKQLHGRLLLKIHLTEHLEITNIRYGIGSKVLRMEFEKNEGPL